jgi:predicted nucleotide-binding protein (sugar kinase/HSP70/actin superfamily)
MDICKKSVCRGGRDAFRKNLIAIARDFDLLGIKQEKRIQVGLVGEIMVKYHPAANNHMAEFLERVNAEMVVPNLTDFFLYCALGREFNHRYMDEGNFQRLFGNLFVRTIERYRDDMRKALRLTSRFKAPDTIYEMADKVKSILSLGNQSGEGWLLTAEIVGLIESGVHSIVCMQPFACLPNHISGRGMLKTLKEKYPEANIMAIDYDAGASQVNQLNRIKLLLDSGKAQ